MTAADDDDNNINKDDNDDDNIDDNGDEDDGQPGNGVFTTCAVFCAWFTMYERASKPPRTQASLLHPTSSGNNPTHPHATLRLNRP